MSKTMKVIIDGKAVEREIAFYRKAEVTNSDSSAREFKRGTPVPVLYEGEQLHEYMDGTVEIVR